MAGQVSFLPYLEGQRLLAHYEIPLAPARLVPDVAAAVAATGELGLPVAVKAISPAASHKSEAGLVRLNLSTEAAVRTAGESLFLAASGSPVEGLLVQAMLPPGVEMIAGVSADPHFGPVLAVGSGGILVELLDDAVLRLPPLTDRQARQMIAETRAWPLLQGFRSRPPADVAALASLLVKLSYLALDQSAWLESLDLNPVIVLPAGQGAWVVDLRLAVRGTEAG